MANISKFAKLYADKTFEEEPFCEADVIVGSLFSYALFEETETYKKYNLGEKTCKSHVFSDNNEVKMMCKNYLNPKIFEKFITPLFTSKRYKDVEVGHIIHFLSESDVMQFCTFSIITKNYNLVFFRGTDISILGRKENFNMLLEDSIPSWEAAKKYVEKISKLNKKPIIIAGHSKGGNLAYYAYFNSSKEIQNRVKYVFNFDGPGFKVDNYDYSEFGTKIFKYVPRDDIVGVIFDYSDNMIPISTSKRGVNAHDLLTWDMDKKENYRKIKRVKNFTNLSLTFRKSSALWLRKWGKESMKELVDFIVGIATSNDCKNLFELKLDIIKARKVYLDKISNYDEDTKDRLKVISRDLVKIYFRILLHLNEYNNKGERIE